MTTKVSFTSPLAFIGWFVQFNAIIGGAVQVLHQQGVLNPNVVIPALQAPFSVLLNTIFVLYTALYGIIGPLFPSVAVNTVNFLPVFLTSFILLLLSIPLFVQMPKSGKMRQ